MAITISNQSVIIFDLDDTLYKEIEFLKSAFKEIAQVLEEEIGENVFDEMILKYFAGEEVFGAIIKQHEVQSKSKEEVIELYRNHQPTLHLQGIIAYKLKEIKKKCIAVGLITDGRSTTQRNKLKSLGLENYFDEVLISEEFGSAKPDPGNFKFMREKLQGKHYAYIGDNISKDFIVPNKLGWDTICVLDNGLNIHPQNFESIESPMQRPQSVIKDLNDLQFETN